MAKCSACSSSWGLLSVFGSCGDYELAAVGDRHDGIEIARQLEDILLKVINEGWEVGAIVTDDAGQCARARRILALRWPRIVFLRCFVHDVNNLVKAVLNSAFGKVTKQAGDAVKALNASSAKWLLRAKTAMCAVYEERPPSFLTLCETRWNSMHGCFASLLRVKTALENLAHHYRNDKTLPAALKVFSDPNFWMDLAAAESVTYPLAQASLRLQSDDNTVADVTRSFYKIYKGFSTCLYEFQLMPSLEHRWKQCEQPLLLLGLGLHPKYVAMYRRLMKMAPDRCTSKDAHLISWRFFVESGLYYYHRLTGTPGGTLYGELSDWITGTSGYLVSTSALDSDLVPRFWNSVQLERPQSKLPELAIIILSIAVNTATCERYFSDLGVIHTPKRNGLKVPKVRQMSATRRFLREKFADYYNAKLKMKKPVNAAELRRRADPDSLDELTETSATDNGPGPEIQGNESSSLDSTEVDEIVEPEIAISSWLSVIGEMTSADEVNTAENGDTAVEVDEMDEITDASLEAVVSGQAQISGMSNNYRDEDDEIPEADRRPLPQENDPLFSQESILRGLRGRKTPHADLFENQQLDAEFLSQ